MTQNGVEIHQHLCRIPLLRTDDLSSEVPLTVDNIRFWNHRGPVPAPYVEQLRRANVWFKLAATTKCDRVGLAVAVAQPRPVPKTCFRILAVLFCTARTDLHRDNNENLIDEANQNAYLSRQIEPGRIRTLRLSLRGRTGLSGWCALNLFVLRRENIVRRLFNPYLVA